MPSTLAAYRLAEGWRRRIIQQRNRAWQQLLVVGFSAEALALVVGQSQRAMVPAADRFLADFLTLEKADPTPAVGLAPAAYVTTDKTIRAYRTAQQRHGREQLHTALSHIVNSDITWSARTAQRDAMDVQQDVDGWRRMAGSNPCPMCRELADGSVLPPSVDVAAHPSCSCIATPSVRGRNDRYVPPTFATEE